MFDTREEALERMMTMRTNKVNKKNVEGRRFWSEKLQMSFRSNWEIELAEMLTELGIKFEFEPQRFYFRREKESYLPDFFLPEYNCWIEVKGYMDERSLKRVKLFKKYYSSETSFFLYEKEERELALKNPAILMTLIEVAREEMKRK
ncbi:hypothetical protein [Priestia megaterium]|uniref:hypothetical protein n=1 Tax=Priestia megaterium TaxID=1404 RepID=UPI001C54DF9B|nr:hypothetical protein [Priestia megaterium]